MGQFSMEITCPNRSLLGATQQADHAAKEAAAIPLRRVAVAQTGFIGRIVVRLDQYRRESPAWIKANPIAAARNAEFLARMVALGKKLWDEVAAGDIPWPF